MNHQTNVREPSENTADGSFTLHAPQGRVNFFGGVGSILLRFFCLGVFLCLLSGCAGYQIGNSQLYRPDIRTVYVPPFRSDSYRRGVGELLTEAVVKEIEDQTPYKVVQSTDADSTLVGNITDYRKQVLAESAFDTPRDLNTQLIVELTWTARSGELLIPKITAPIAVFQLTATESANFVPEGGQSFASSELEAVQDMAKKIVAQMELGL